MPHIRRIGEEQPRQAGKRRRHKPRRWGAEGTIGWPNRCRSILVRYQKKAANYLGVLQLAPALLWYHQLHRLG